MKIIVTGGAGFIGSALVRYLVNETEHEVLNLDKLTYAGNLESLAAVEGHPRYRFEQADICDRAAVERVFGDFKPDAIMHLAAESHVDRSIDRPADFIQTNVVGTYTLLEVARGYWQALPASARERFRFHHVSTDEVYGDLAADDPPFSEATRYDPHSPYSASKAGADHLVRAWHHTYGLPVLLTNCSNNYGAYQFPEKLVPLTILNAIEGRALPVYGQGRQVRDWLFVEDHVKVLYRVLTSGQLGRTYNIGGNSERRNIDTVQAVCALLEELAPDRPVGIAHYIDLITFVADRPGHDRRYAMDTTRVRQELDWQPVESFESGLRKTVQWYLTHLDWCRRVQDGSYQRERLGLLG